MGINSKSIAIKLKYQWQFLKNKLMRIKNLFNSSQVIITIATVVLAFSTIILACYTKSLVDSTNKYTNIAGKNNELLEKDILLRSSPEIIVLTPKVVTDKKDEGIRFIFQNTGFQALEFRFDAIIFDAERNRIVTNPPRLRMKGHEYILSKGIDPFAKDITYFSFLAFDHNRLTTSNIFLILYTYRGVFESKLYSNYVAFKYLESGVWQKLPKSISKEYLTVSCRDKLTYLDCGVLNAN